MTQDETALRQVMRLRGYSLMKNILEDYKEDIETLVLVWLCEFLPVDVHIPVGVGNDVVMASYPSEQSRRFRSPQTRSSLRRTRE